MSYFIVGEIPTRKCDYMNKSQNHFINLSFSLEDCISNNLNRASSYNTPTTPINFCSDMIKCAGSLKMFNAFSGIIFNKDVKNILESKKDLTSMIDDLIIICKPFLSEIEDYPQVIVDFYYLIFVQYNLKYGTYFDLWLVRKRLNSKFVDTKSDTQFLGFNNLEDFLSFGARNLDDVKSNRHFSFNFFYYLSVILISENIDLLDENIDVDNLYVQLHINDKEEIEFFNFILTAFNNYIYKYSSKYSTLFLSEASKDFIDDSNLKSNIVDVKDYLPEYMFYHFIKNKKFMIDHNLVGLDYVLSYIDINELQLFRRSSDVLWYLLNCFELILNENNFDPSEKIVFYYVLLEYLDLDLKFKLSEFRSELIYYYDLKLNDNNTINSNKYEGVVINGESEVYWFLFLFHPNYCRSFNTIQVNQVNQVNQIESFLPYIYFLSCENNLNVSECLREIEHIVNNFQLNNKDVKHVNFDIFKKEIKKIIEFRSI